MNHNSGRRTLHVVPMALQTSVSENQKYDFLRRYFLTEKLEINSAVNREVQSWLKVTGNMYHITEVSS